MSYELASWFVTSVKANAAITALLGKDSDGNPSVFPYHSRTTDQQPPFPKLTFARFGSLSGDRFNGTPFANLMDHPRFAVCVWSQDNIETCWRIYRLVDAMLRGPTLLPIANQFFGAYKASRSLVRDDLFDTQLNSFHLHSEYGMPVQTLVGVAQA